MGFTQSDGVLWWLAAGFAALALLAVLALLALLAVLAVADDAPAARNETMASTATAVAASRDGTGTLLLARRGSCLRSKEPSL